MEMIKDLSKEGISIKDLVIEKKENGKTYYDNTNKIELENSYIEAEQEKVYRKIIKETFNKEAEELFLDIGISTEQEMQDFSVTFAQVLTGQYQSPSEKK